MPKLPTLPELPEIGAKMPSLPELPDMTEPSEMAQEGYDKVMEGVQEIKESLTETLDMMGQVVLDPLKRVWNKDEQDETENKAETDDAKANEQVTNVTLEPIIEEIILVEEEQAEDLSLKDEAETETGEEQTEKGQSETEEEQTDEAQSKNDEEQTDEAQSENEEEQANEAQSENEEEQTNEAPSETEEIKTDKSQDANEEVQTYEAQTESQEVQTDEVQTKIEKGREIDTPSPAVEIVEEQERKKEEGENIIFVEHEEVEDSKILKDINENSLEGDISLNMKA